MANLCSIREAARTGILTEHALRQLAKQGKLPAIYIGKKCLVNLDQLREQLDSLPGNITRNGVVDDD